MLKRYTDHFGHFGHKSDDGDMRAPEILVQISAAGVALLVQGDTLVAKPATRLTDDLRSLIRAHKPAILAALAASAVPDRAVDLRGARTSLSAAALADLPPGEAPTPGGASPSWDPRP